MSRLIILAIALLMAVRAAAQYGPEFTVVSRRLGPGAYDPAKAERQQLRVFRGERAQTEFDKLLDKDPQLRDLYIEDVTDGEGNFLYSIRETYVYEYYPDMGIVLQSGGHGFAYVFDVKRKVFLCGSPEFYAYSPSAVYRLSGLESDGMNYFLEKKEGPEYQCLGPVRFEGDISGYYWVDEETIHYLRRFEKPDGAPYHVAYSGRFVR